MNKEMRAYQKRVVALLLALLLVQMMLCVVNVLLIEKITKKIELLHKNEYVNWN